MTGTAFCLSLGVLLVATADDRPERSTISVSGSGKISAAPDVAEINVGVVTQAATARDALSANNEAMEALQKVLKERGVAAKDVQTQNINIQPQYSQPRPTAPGQEPREYVPKVVSYHVTNTVQVTARELGKLGQVLDAVVQAGANQMYGISFRINEPEKLLDEARKKAVANAKHKAELLAGEAGVVVGAPISIQEESAPSPRPMMFGGRGMATMAAAPAVPVAPGEQDLSVTVHVIYELKAAK